MQDKIVYEDDEMRVLHKKGRAFDEFIVFNYVRRHPDEELIFGKSFFNQQLAQKHFAEVKASNYTIKRESVRMK